MKGFALPNSPITVPFLESTPKSSRLVVLSEINQDAKVTPAICKWNCWSFKNLMPETLTRSFRKRPDTINSTAINKATNRLSYFWEIIKMPLSGFNWYWKIPEPNNFAPDCSHCIRRFVLKNVYYKLKAQRVSTTLPRNIFLMISREESIG